MKEYYKALLEEYKDNVEAQHLILTICRDNKSVFLSGKAGTGKSTLIRKLTNPSNGVLIGHKKFIRLAFTGVAAIQIEGKTIHSFFGLGIQPYHPQDFKKWYQHKIDLIKKIDLFVIDEVSMLRSDVLHVIDHSLRRNLNSPLPFAGKQMLFVGDMFQLPPIVGDTRMAGADQSTDDISNIIQKHYTSAYFFSAHAFYNPTFYCCFVELKKVYRQSSDQAFLAILDRMRLGYTTAEDIQVLNNTHRQPYSEDTIQLTSHRYNKDVINQKKFNQLSHPAHMYTAIVEGDFRANEYPANMELQLKKDAQVILLANDSEGRWANGDIGRITHIGTMMNAEDEEINVIQVQLDRNHEIYTIERYKWSKYELYFNTKRNSIDVKEIASFMQYPLDLAYAITIHKSQGLTLPNIILNMERRIFANGQLYVALSRCTSLKGIRIVGAIQPSDIRIDKKLQLLYEDLHVLQPCNIGDVIAKHFPDILRLS